VTLSSRSHLDLSSLEGDAKKLMWIKVQLWSAIVATVFLLFIALSNRSYIFAILVIAYGVFMISWCQKNWNRGRSEESDSVAKHE
jgi:hypothetical protein